MRRAVRRPHAGGQCRRTPRASAGTTDTCFCGGWRNRGSRELKATIGTTDACPCGGWKQRARADKAARHVNELYDARERRRGHGPWAQGSPGTARPGRTFCGQRQRRDGWRAGHELDQPFACRCHGNQGHGKSARRSPEARAQSGYRGYSGQLAIGWEQMGARRGGASGARAWCHVMLPRPHGHKTHVCSHRPRTGPQHRLERCAHAKTRMSEVKMQATLAAHIASLPM